MFRIYNLLMFIVLFITGCGYFDGYETVDMGVEDVSVLSISEQRPADVTFAIGSFYHNTCVSTPKVYAVRENQTIKVGGTMDVCPTCTCGDAISDIQGKALVENLEVGEYNIVGEFGELMSLHIEDATAFVVKRPHIVDVRLSVRTDDSVEWHEFMKNNPDAVTVTAHVQGYFTRRCQPLLSTHIDRKGDDIVVDIAAEMSIDSECQYNLNPYERNSDYYETQIELGKIPPGRYAVKINNWQGWLNEEL